MIISKRRNDWKWRYKYIRKKVYKFLETPSDNTNLVYQLSVVIYCVFVVSAAGFEIFDEQQDTLNGIIISMEILLAVFFIVEYALRLWCVGICAKYQGFKGRIKYLCQFLPVIDTIIVIAAIIQPIFPKDHRARFLLVLRLIHLDRNGVSLSALETIIVTHFSELRAAMFLAWFFLLLMTAVVDVTENLEEEGRNTFKNGWSTSIWWGLVTIATVGYGDIVPKNPGSQLVTSLMSIVCIALFGVTASLVGVGLTLQVQENQMKKQQAKIRPLAARVIQNFMREHLTRKKFEQITFYRRKFVPRLAHYDKLTIDEINENDLNEYANENSLLIGRPTVKFKVEKMPSVKKIFAKEKDDAVPQRRMSSASLYDTIQTIALKTAGLRTTISTEYLPQQPGTDNQFPPQILINDTDVMENQDDHVQDENIENLKENRLDMKNTTEMPYRLYLNRQHQSQSKNDLWFARSTQSKYKCALQCIWTFKFACAMTRFSRARKPYSYEEATVEVSDNENIQLQKLSQLQRQLDLTIGTARASILDSSTTEVTSIDGRLVIVEEQMVKLNETALQIDDLLQNLLADL